MAIQIPSGRLRVGSHHAELEVDFEHPVTFDHALTMEWLNDGQHVEKYAIEIWDETAAPNGARSPRPRPSGTRRSTPSRR